MAINRTDIAAHLEQSARVGLLKGMKDYQPMRSAFVREFPSTKAFEVFTDMGDHPWPKQNAGKLGSGGTDGRTNKPKVGDLQSGEAVTAVEGEERGMLVYPVDWEIVTHITHNAIDDDQVGDLEMWMEDAGRNFERHKDYIAFNALNAGEAATYGYGYDGQYFFSASHADPGAEYTTAQDNQYALTLGTDLDNFETVEVAASKFLDSRGQPVGFSHNLLIVASDLKRTARNITGNAQDFGVADRAINPYSGETRLVVAPGGWLDTTAWYLVDDSQSAKPLNLVVRKAPELVIWDDESQGDGGVRYYKWHARYNIAYGDWRLAIQGNT